MEAMTCVSEGCGCRVMRGTPGEREGLCPECWESREDEKEMCRQARMRAAVKVRRGAMARS
jgi:hypothetical protein